MSINKNWNPDEHPRNKYGEFIEKSKINEDSTQVKKDGNINIPSNVVNFFKQKKINECRNFNSFEAYLNEQGYMIDDSVKKLNFFL